MQKQFFLTALLVCGASLWASAQEWKQEVTVFKSGQTFFAETHTRSTDDSARVYFKDLPEFRFGTFKASATPELYGIRSLKKEEKKTAFLTFAKLLEEYKGKKVRILFKANRAQKSLDGTVLGKQGDYISLKTAEAPLQIVHLNDIEQVQALEAGPTEYSYSKAVRQLEFQLKNQSSKAKIDLSFMVNGAGWAPQYELELLDDKQAKLTLKSLLINDVRDIREAKVNFIVGVPNFKFAAQTVSPLVSDESFWSFMSNLGSIAQAPAAPAMRNVMAMQTRSRAVAEAAFYDMAEDDAAGGYMPEAPSEVSGETEEDFFVYSTDRISLPKGGRGLFNLFETKIPYKHVYEAKLRPNSGSFSRSKDKPDVWHSLELENTSNYTWTTGAATAWPIADKSKPIPLSQERLDYTPPKAKTTLRLTQSPDIEVVAQEEELSRETGKKIRRQVYDILEVKGTIRVHNLKGKAITLDLRRRITGVLKNSSLNWKKEKRPGRYGENELYDVHWEVELKAGEEKEIKYEYTVYLAR